MDEYSKKVRAMHVSWYNRGFMNPWSDDGKNTTWGKVADKHKIVMVL
jgi:hypothetical protein